MHLDLNQCRIELIKGDIVTQHVDAIINAANSALSGGGGVDGAIHRAAGPALWAECRTLGRCPTGAARITQGYRLPARYVIHAVGPVYRDGQSGEAELLAGAYRSSLELATQHHLTTLAFPAISAGIYGYPLDQAAAIALRTTIAYVRTQSGLRLIRFVLWNDQTFAAFQRALEQYRMQINVT